MAKLTQKQYIGIKLVISQMPGLVLLKDMNLVYLICNPSFAKVCGFDHPDQIAGITSYDIKSEMVTCADLFVTQDKKVIATDKALTSLNIVPGDADKMQAFIHTKSIFKGSDGDK